jgi:hypothetical protein
MATTKQTTTAHDGEFRSAAPTLSQISWLRRGLAQPGGKLPLFDDTGQRVNARTIRSCVSQGWAEPWFRNPTKPDWLICKLTLEGRRISE